MRTKKINRALKPQASPWRSNDAKEVWAATNSIEDHWINDVEFARYTGNYPNLCAGTLTIRIDSAEYESNGRVMNSGGCIFPDGYDGPDTSQGPWEIDINCFPIEIHAYKEAIEAAVNMNVEFGCCGGCV